MSQEKSKQSLESENNKAVSPEVLKVKRHWCWSIAIMLCCLVMFMAGGCFSGATQENSKTATDESMVSGCMSLPPAWRAIKALPAQITLVSSKHATAPPIFAFMLFGSVVWVLQ